MAFSADMQVNSGIAKITLSGELDASVAPTLQSQVEQAAAQSDLDYMASAGLRALIFAKQKIGVGVDLYVVGAQPQVMEVIQKTGFDRSIIVMAEYDPTVIENL
jgi:anti-sigma B factor antagonist